MKALTIKIMIIMSCVSAGIVFAVFPKTKSRPEFSITSTESELETEVEIEYITTQATTEETAEGTIEETATIVEETEPSSTETASSPQDNLIVRYVIVDVLNVRTEPSLDSMVLSTIYSGDWVYVFESTINDTWAKVYIQGEFFYVYSEFLSEFCPENTIICTEPTTEVPTAPAIEITETEPPTTTPPAASFNYYSVNGDILDYSLQEHAYNMCVAYGIEFYYPYFLCQMYQESRFNQGSISTSGAYGLCQLKVDYFNDFRQYAGNMNLDFINSPYDNIQGGVAFMAYNLSRCNGDIYKAISTYLTGDVNTYSEKYVNDVSQWFTTLVKLN